MPVVSAGSPTSLHGGPLSPATSAGRCYPFTVELSYEPELPISLQAPLQKAGSRFSPFLDSQIYMEMRTLGICWGHIVGTFTFSDSVKFEKFHF